MRQTVYPGTHERRFAGRDQARFVALWNELAAILNTPPLELDENRRIDELLDAAAKRTGDSAQGILDDVLAFAVDNSTGEPGPDWTVGGLIDWLLETGPPKSDERDLRTT